MMEGQIVETSDDIMELPAWCNVSKTVKQVRLCFKDFLHLPGFLQLSTLQVEIYGRAEPIRCIVTVAES